MGKRLWATAALICSFHQYGLFAQPADAIIIHKLEAGSVLSQKGANIVRVHAIVKQNYAKIAPVFNSDLTKLGQIIPNLSFIKPSRLSAERQLVYLKVRGLLDGEGILAEIKPDFYSDYESEDLIASYKKRF